MGQPFFVEVGQLYRGGKINGIQVYSQPHGVGTAVVPGNPTVYPANYQGFPQVPFAFAALYVLGCGHWVNSPEVNKEYDPYTEMQAAIICCPICGYIQLIVEPFESWFDKFYGLYSLGSASDGVFGSA